SVRPQEPVDLARRDVEADVVHRREGAVLLDEVLDADHRCYRGGRDQQPRSPPSRRGIGMSIGLMSEAVRPTSTGVDPGATCTSSADARLTVGFFSRSALT